MTTFEFDAALQRQTLTSLATSPVFNTVACTIPTCPLPSTYYPPYSHRPVTWSGHPVQCPRPIPWLNHLAKVTRALPRRCRRSRKRSALQTSSGCLSALASICLALVLRQRSNAVSALGWMQLQVATLPLYPDFRAGIQAKYCMGIQD